MKLIRLTDDRYVLDVGSEVTMERADHITQAWTGWWSKHPGEIPRVLVVGGDPTPIEYEDRREPDIESRLRALENHFHTTGLIDRSGPPRSE